MLKFYRKNIKFIIWGIVLSFVAWGAGTISISKQSASPYIGSVGSEKISHKEFMITFRYYDLLAHAQQSKIDSMQDQKETKDNPSSEPLSFDQLKALTWQAIVLSREAKREGIHISDEEVRSEVEKLFSAGGGFDQEFYHTWVRTNFRGRARDFEEAIRKHIAVQKIREKVLKGVPEKDQEARWLDWLKPVISQARVHDFTTENTEASD